MQTRMRVSSLLSLAAVLVAGGPMVVAGEDQVDQSVMQRIPDLKVERYTLPNGLQVILHEDHSVPIVAVNLWYHVGSKNERPGRTGFAHLFEHLMFQGSKHHDDDYFKPLQAVGGSLNGSTTFDRTNYWEVVPSNCLELALWLEADRMGFLLPALTRERFENQREVVKNERRQRYENQPYGLASEVLSAAMYPPNHPYHWPVIGYMKDLDAATRDDAAEFFLKYYHPANASLCIAGDFDPEEAKRLVERYFGPIPAGPQVQRYGRWVPEIDEERRVVMHDRVSLPRIYLAWHTVPYFAEDDAALDVLASVLSAGKSARLYKALVHEKQLAAEVMAFQESREIAGRFLIIASPRPGHSVEELEAAIEEELAKLQETPPEQSELERAINIFEARFVRSFEAVGGFGGKADQLNAYNVFLGDPLAYKQDFARYLKVTPEDVQRVARTYLSRPRVVLTILPGPERTEPQYVKGSPPKREVPPPGALPEEPAVAGEREVRDQIDRSRMPAPGPTPSFSVPGIHRFTLDNGIPVLLMEHHELPLLSLGVIFRGGSADDPPDKPGLSDALAAMLDEGTDRRSSLEIAEELAGIGATFSVSAGTHFFTVRLGTLKRQLDRAMDVLADVLQNPTFPDAELERQRALAIAGLMRLRDNPNALAGLAFAQQLFGPEHPYGRPSMGTIRSWRAFQRDDLVELYRGRIRPERATIVLVGDTTVEEAKAFLNRYLGNWRQEGMPSELADVPIPAERPTHLVIVDKPGAAQSVIQMGHLAPPRTSPDYYALQVMNTVFGGQFSSRLNMNLREDKGFTYGARSTFVWRLGPSYFSAASAVATPVTGPALAEFFREFDRLVRSEPPTEAEVAFAKNYIINGYPRGFETTGDLAAKLALLVRFGLPDDYFNTYIPSIQAVQVEDVRRVAREHIRPDRLTVIVVGDRQRIGEPVGKVAGDHPVQVGTIDEEFRLRLLEPSGQDEQQ